MHVENALISTAVIAMLIFIFTNIKAKNELKRKLAASDSPETGEGKNG